MTVSRRQLFRGLIAAAAAPACKRKTPPMSPVPSVRLATGSLALHSWFDLPDDPRSRELSGIAWDGQERTLWAVQDGKPSVVPLVPDEELTHWRLGAPIRIATTMPLDLEAIVCIHEGFLLGSELGPHLIEVDRRGAFRRELELPAHFAFARRNKSLESLTMSPSGKYLYTTTEWSLGCDGATPTLETGTRIRILRLDRDGAHAEEHAYLTDPLPAKGGDYGVSDLVALSDDDLLVLERGWSPHVGNTARIFVTNLADGRASCLFDRSLADRAVLQKKLLLDLSTLPASELPPSKQPQASRLMDNYEGMTLGPELASGKRSLILATDDNNRHDQVPRVLVLAHDLGS